jgi:hypothetical protein
MEINVARMTYDASKNTIPKDLGNLFVPNAL